MPAGDDMTYSTARIDGKDVAAVFKGDGSLPVHCNSYVTVDDVDAMPEKVKAAGGEVMAEPFDYWVIQNGGRSNGGVRPIDNSRPGDVRAHCLPYFACEDVGTAKSRTEELGGRSFSGPTEVPGGSFVVAGDPQGGAFALFAGEFDDQRTSPHHVVREELHCVTGRHPVQ